METIPTVNLWAGPPLGADSRTRFDWQCKTLALWICSSEESVKEFFSGLLASAATSLRNSLMKISVKRFGEREHPHLDTEQMYDALYPILVHVVDVVASLNPPMTMVREVANASRLFNTIHSDFSGELNAIPAKFEKLLERKDFYEAFTELCRNLESIVRESNAPTT